MAVVVWVEKCEGRKPYARLDSAEKAREHRITAGVTGAADQFPARCRACAGAHLVDPPAPPRPCAPKQRYLSRTEANEALVAVRHKRSLSVGDPDWRAECRSYRCPGCDGWHLTSARGRAS